MKFYLQNIVESINLKFYPTIGFNLTLLNFSESKNLFDYQQNALKNTLKALYKYFVDNRGDKKSFFDLYKNNGFTENLDL